METRDKKRVLVTGSSRGIGEAIARELATLGFDLTLHCRTRLEDAERVAQEITAEADARCDVLQFDVSDRKAAAAELEAVLEKKGPYYGVVLNAGLTRDGIFPAMSGEDWDEVIGTNLGGFYNVLHPLVMPMIGLRDGGRIVVVSSLAGVIGQRGQVSYSASKAGVIGASKALALELAKRRITVNCIAPGFIETEMISELPRAEIEKLVPMKRLGRVDEVAALAGYLFSPRAGYLTGQVISMNGGIA